jgi:benzoylformate decarboxylase
MTRSGADYFVEAIQEYGVEYLFGNPGTTEVPIVEAADRSDLEYVLGVHEDIAVGMASGYACTRREHGDETPVGVVNLHIAPGMAHGLGNLYGAARANAPVIVTTGAHKTATQHQEPILQGDVVEMTRQYTKWSAEVKDSTAIPSMLRRAFKVATTPPMGPVFLAFPVDTLLGEVSEPVRPYTPTPELGPGRPEGIERAAEIIADGEEATIIAGAQIAWDGEDAIDEAVRLAEASGARVHGEVLQSAIAFPTGHDQWVSAAGKSADALREIHDADTLLLLGCSHHTPTLGHTEPITPPDTDVVAVGTNPWEIGKNEPVDVSLLGDVSETLEALADAVEDRVPESERERRLEAVREFKAAKASGADDADGDGAETERFLSKPELADAIAEVAPEAYLVDESVTTRGALYTQIEMGPRQLHGNKSGGLGYGLPAAVGAAIAENDRENPRSVIGTVGDGSYLYYPHSLYSAARYDVDLTVLVSNNHNYRILKDNAARVLGERGEDPEFSMMDFDPGVDFVQNAESHGADAASAETYEELVDELESAIDDDGANVIDVAVRD